MRNWKNWLVPLTTCLMVVCLAVLPIRLSALRDQSLFGTVHAETLGEDSNFPSKPPELPGRLWLLAQLQSWPDTLTIVNQEMESEELEKVLPELWTELEALEAAGILPEDSWEEAMTVSGSRIYLRDQTNLSSAAFWALSAYNQKTGTSMLFHLDGETDQIVSLRLWAPQLWKEYPDPAAAGMAFLDRLELGYETLGEEQGAAWALFRLTECRVLYEVLTGKELQIIPQVDWAAMDEEDGQLFGIANGIITDSDR